VISIFDRYVFRQAAGATLLILFSLCGVVWIALALKQLKLVTSKGQDTLTLLTMTTLAVPNLMALIAPIALLIATIHTLNRLNGDSELIVLTASGATIWRVARPLIFLALLLSLAVSFVNHYAMPWSLRMLRVKITEVRSDLLSQVLLPGRFSSPESGVTIHIRDKTRDDVMLGLVIHDSRKRAEFITYLAEQGRIVKTKTSAYLSMTNGHMIRHAGNVSNWSGPPSILAFKSYAVDLERFEKKLGVQEWRPRERYFSELAFPDVKSKSYALEKGHYRAELHERFSNPLYPFVFVLIAVGFVGRAQSTRSNHTRMMAAGFVVAISFRLVGLGVNNIVTLNEAATLILYILPAAGIGLGLAMLQFGGRARKGPGLGDHVDAAIQWVVDRLPKAWWRRATPNVGG